MQEYTVRVYCDRTIWLQNNKRHREDGPAIEYKDGKKLWFLEGVNLTKEEHNKKVSLVKEMTVEEISKQLGFKVKII